MKGLTGQSGRFKRVQHDAEKSGKELSHAQSTKYERMDDRVFSLYQSTVTDQAKDIKGENLLFKSPKFILVCVFLFLSLASIIIIFSLAGNPLSAQPVIEEKTSVTELPSKTFTPDVSHPKASDDLPHRHDGHGLSFQNTLTTHLIDAIQYHDMTTVIQKAGRYQVFHYFVSSLGRLSGDDLIRLGYQLRFFSGMVLIYNDQYQRFVPIGNPRPDYYHPDNVEPLSGSTDQPIDTQSFIPSLPSS